MREGTVQLDQLPLNANDRSLCRDEKSRHLSRLQWSYSISKSTKEVVGIPSIFQTRHPLWSIVRLSVLKPDNPPSRTEIPIFAIRGHPMGWETQNTPARQLPAIRIQHVENTNVKLCTMQLDKLIYYSSIWN
jgi:hypothetical protein